MQKLLALLTLLLLPGTVLGFTDNSGVPTTNNTPIPINSSSSTQVKTGPLVSDSYMQADFFFDRYNYRYYLQPRGTNRLHSVVADNTLTYGEVQGAFFRDRNDRNFYVDPNGASRMNYIEANNTLTYGNSITNGEVQGAFFRDRNDGTFYVDPNGVSVLNDIRPAIIYDRNNTGYYVDPNGNSRMNYVVFNNTYTYGAGNYADVYLRNAGRWASQVGQISTSLHYITLSPGWQTRYVNAQFCALSDKASWTWGYHDLDAVHCRAYPIGTNTWRLQAIGYGLNREVNACGFACINP